MNLQGKELKKLFEKCIDEALKEIETEVDASITFKFLYMSDKKIEKSIEKITKGYGSYKIKNLNIPSQCVKEVFLDNLNYNYYYLLDKETRTENPTIHGHGEYWGAKHITYIFGRHMEQK